MSTFTEVQPHVYVKSQPRRQLLKLIKTSNSPVARHSPPRTQCLCNELQPHELVRVSMTGFFFFCAIAAFCHKVGVIGCIWRSGSNVQVKPWGKTDVICAIYIDISSLPSFAYLKSSFLLSRTPSISQCSLMQTHCERKCVIQPMGLVVIGACMCCCWLLFVFDPSLPRLYPALAYVSTGCLAGVLPWISRRVTDPSNLPLTMRRNFHPSSLNATGACLTCRHLSLVGDFDRARTLHLHSDRSDSGVCVCVCAAHA